MQLPSTTKTETRALNAIERIIDEHETMSHQFNACDKEMSWDGYIWLFKENNGSQTKDNLDARVPVQIKGHYDPKHKYFGKKKIPYPVDIADLKAYSTEKGVLYFQVFVDGRSKSEIYYSSLYPSKICDCLDRAQQRKITGTMNISFMRLEQTSEEIYIVAKQFSEESRVQGSSYSPLVIDRLKIDDFGKLKELKATIVGASDEYDAIRRMASGDVCLYGKTEEDKYYRPFEWKNQLRFEIGGKIEQSVTIDGEEFYTSYISSKDSNGRVEIVLSQNLKLLYTEGKFKFEFKTTIEEIAHDSEFVLKLQEGSAFYIEGVKIEYHSFGIGNSIKEKLQYIIELRDALAMIGVDTKIKVSDLTQEMKKQLYHLVNITKLDPKDIPDRFSIFEWKLGDKFFPLLILRGDKKTIVESAIYTEKYAYVFEGDDVPDSDKHRAPLFLLFREEILCHLLKYDFDMMKKKIDECDIDEITAPLLADKIKVLIKVYDESRMEQFLELAYYLLDKLEAFIEKDIFELNSVEIRERKRAAELNRGLSSR